MWDLYGKGTGVVAVKTTVGRLKSNWKTMADHSTSQKFNMLIGRPKGTPRHVRSDYAKGH